MKNLLKILLILGLFNSLNSTEVRNDIVHDQGCSVPPEPQPKKLTYFEQLKAKAAKTSAAILVVTQKVKENVAKAAQQVKTATGIVASQVSNANYKDWFFLTALVVAQTGRRFTEPEDMSGILVNF